MSDFEHNSDTAWFLQKQVDNLTVLAANGVVRIFCLMLGIIRGNLRDESTNTDFAKARFNMICQILSFKDAGKDSCEIVVDDLKDILMVNSKFAFIRQFILESMVNLSRTRWVFSDFCVCFESSLKLTAYTGLTVLSLPASVYATAFKVARYLPYVMVGAELTGILKEYTTLLKRYGKMGLGVE